MDVPFLYGGKRRYAIGVLIFFSTFYITYFLRPHDVKMNELKMSYWWICVIHSILPTMIFLMFSWLGIKFLKRGGRWNLGYESLFILLLLTFIGIGNFLVRDLIYYNANNWAAYLFFEEVGNTFFIGLLIITLVILVNVNFKHFSYRRQAKNLKAILQKSSEVLSEEVMITTQVKNEAFSLDPQAFLFAKSEGNYVEIYHKSSNAIEKEFKRITLSNLYEFLSDFPYIVRVHKSFLVNLHEVADISGNALGLKLKMRDDRIAMIPVSRKNILHFKQSMERIGK